MWTKAGRKRSRRFTGKTHTKQSRAKTSASLKKAYREGRKTYRGATAEWHKGKQRSAVSRERMSKARIEGIMEGRIALDTARKYKQGWFWSEKNRCRLYYRSSLELSWFMVLERLTNVIAYMTEPFPICYAVGNVVHRYLPDVLVEYVDHSLELIEIKPESLQSTPINRAKKLAAEQWCKANQVKFSIVGYRELKYG